MQKILIRLKIILTFGAKLNKLMIKTSYRRNWWRSFKEVA